ncbi:hypothetical protein CWI42_070670 [Ordospora colligata]|uniref:Uncharacterized protein n=1 Tax=Ordospora colligata OC4 TaxID=1354746 RepID=A0A0B2UKC0_9MICR|nr:uncharacterized protein M896_070660 [Ordospora colligata OC4]KHN69497.1 hypothetical protein M896_070660 [Ordospora colligata OC4]TBU15241.1 hypothetical protein CWI41_070660 [Ordospora colligata]TBU15312.1 hypothetical protein CWI40_070660 [Ordospora colligata]TBU18495.1 hypothetical protein CWI42_070670 [Ordospora colligata]
METVEVDEGTDEPDGNRLSMAIDAAYRVMDSVKSWGKCDEECALCDMDVCISTSYDVVEIYCHLLACVSDHVLEVSPIAFEDFFVFEVFVLDQICEREVFDVRRILETTDCHRNVNYRVEYTCNQRRILELVNRCFPGEMINIQCEQVFESLMYKVYSKYSESGIQCVSSKDLELLLIVLFRRIESSRFFKVLNSTERTQGMMMLGILLALKEDNNTLVDKLQKEMIFIDESLESHFVESMGLINMAIDVNQVLLTENMDEWITHRKEEMNWEERVHFWALNRDGSCESLNKSMMSLCIKHRKYDDGWAIYCKGCKKTSDVIHKGCILALNALKETDDQKWILRLFETVEESFSSGEGEAGYIAANDVLKNLSCFTEITRDLVLKEFVLRMDFLERNEQIVNLMIRELVELCKDYENDQDHAQYGEYTSLIYGKWKANKINGKYVIGGSEEVESEMYLNVLSVFDCLCDRNKILEVLGDIVNSNMKITKELSLKMQAISKINLGSIEVDSSSLEQYAVLERLMSLALQKH